MEGLSSQSFLKFLLQHGDDSKKITDNAISGNFKDRSLRVFVDGDNDIRCLHPSLMLNRARDSAGNVDLGPDRTASLSNLLFVWDPARINGCTRGTYGCTQDLCQCPDHLKIFTTSQTSSSRDND